MSVGKAVLGAFLGLVLFSLALQFIPRAIQTLQGEPATERTTPTRAEYLERVREVNPEDPEFYTCIYEQMIDERGLRGAFRFDLKYADASIELEPGDVADLSRYARACEGV